MAFFAGPPDERDLREAPAPGRQCPIVVGLGTPQSTHPCCTDAMMTKTPRMKLYYSPNSPYARKVLVCAHELALIDAIETIDQAAFPHQPDHSYAKHNPLMKLPTLERADGMHLFDSVVICEYLDDLGKGSLFPRAGEPRWQALRLHALADGIMDASILVRYETALRPAALRWEAWREGQFAKIDHALDAVDAAALDGPLDIGCISVACALGYLDLRLSDHPWRPGRDALAAWFEKISARPSLQATRPPG